MLDSIVLKIQAGRGSLLVISSDNDDNDYNNNDSSNGQTSPRNLYSLAQNSRSGEEALSLTIPSKTYSIARACCLYKSKATTSLISTSNIPLLHLSFIREDHVSVQAYTKVKVDPLYIINTLLLLHKLL